MNMQLTPADPAQGWTRFTPQRLDAGVIDLVNALAIRTAPIALPELGKGAFVAIGGNTAIASAGELDRTIAFTLDLPGGLLRVDVPETIVVKLLDLVQPGIGLVAEPLRSMLLTMALAPALDRLEQTLGTAVAVQGHDGSDVADGPQVQLAMALGGGEPKLGRIYFAGNLNIDLFATVQRGLAFAEPLKRELGELTFAVPVTVEVGAVILTLAQIRSLRPGDVVVPDRPSLTAKVGKVRVGALAAPADIEGSSVRMQAALASHQQRSTERAMMDDQPPGAAADVSEPDDALDTIAIDVTFELGRREVALGELRSLGAGHVFDLGKGADEAVDILANGRRIGRGEIVRIGETLGVRTVRLFDHG